MWSNLKLQFHFEITSHCQASCSGCARTFDMTENHPSPVQQKHLSLEELDSLFPNSVLERTSEFFLCGNYGDPLAHPQLAQWIVSIREKFPQIEFWLHTNGGLGSSKTWELLGKTLTRPGDMICFAIDGLEDTNSLYRKGVEWKTLMDNVKTYISNGGRAQWKFISFPHSKHQIEEAKSLSEELGFRQFKVTSPYLGQEYYLDPKRTPYQNTDYKNLKENELSHLLDRPTNCQIKCQALDNKSLFIDAQARVWPCCWLGIDSKNRLNFPRREELHRFLFEKHNYEPNFNSLKHHSLEEIIEHPLFQKDLKDNWNSSSQILKSCSEQCGHFK